MNTRQFADLIANGTVSTAEDCINCAELDWNPHPAFTGVKIRHLITGADTDGQLSCHVVEVDPGCTLEPHIHEGQWELHEVVSGEGKLIHGKRESDYFPGCSAVIPKGDTHSVQAGEKGMTILAKFFPALV